MPKHESDDQRLDWISARGELLKRKCESLDERSKKIKLPVRLPGVHRLSPSADHEYRHRPTQPMRRKRHLHTPSPSPEPGNDYVLAKPNVQSLEDPITQKLNLWRKESDGIKDPLPQPRWVDEISLKISLYYVDSSASNPHSQYRPPQFGDYYRPRQQLPPPTEVARESKDRAKPKETHCNIKYSLEERDYIRFNKVELKLSWEENKSLFGEKFPMANSAMQREKQGIQGVHYRDNGHMPHLVDKGRALLFLDNGHVKAWSVKVREQGEDKPYFGLIYLYPERAILYDWVPAKAKQMAAELIKERISQRERKKREAMARGTWIERLETGECACCPIPDRERDDLKRAFPLRHGHGLDSVDYDLDVEL
ncbi:hypothetical protein AAE478_003809 [Parahypoxylon ruwenzoriense]